MAHTAVSTAAALLKKAHARKISLTPMQVLKLVYIAHGWMLGLYSRPLVSDSVEAWQYGPVIPRLYQAVKAFKNRPVSEIRGATPADLDKAESDLLDQVLEIYGGKTGISLSSITHKPGTPWDKTWVPSEKSTVISNDVIETHYSGLYGKAQSNESA